MTYDFINLEGHSDECSFFFALFCMYPLLTLSVDELAEELHISSPTAYDLVKEPDFPSFRIGKRILVNRAALQRWIDQRSKQPLPDFAGDAA